MNELLTVGDLIAVVIGVGGFVLLLCSGALDADYF
jgi:hypothetical protein